MIKRIHSTLFLSNDIEETCNYYEQLGFDIQKSDKSARIHFGDYRLAFMEGEKESEEPNPDINGHGIFMYFEVESMEAFLSSAEKNGLKIKEQPVEQPWGKKELFQKDPDGYKLIFFEVLT